MNHSKPLVWAMLGFGLACSIASCSTQENKSEKPTVSVNSEKEIIQRGEYLVTTMGCNDCHSPKKMGPKGPEIIPELLLSGYPSDRPIVKFDSPLIKQGFAQLYPDLTAAAGPWGVSFAANLTPDESGIGNWTEDQFKLALTKGKFKGLEHERMLLPPMPWFNFINLKDEDAHAMFQYLKSLKPVKNVVPAPIAQNNM
ncbi:c-type cytochrome [Aquirufa nivalisilvae]|uniref:c-type cytochrome n=1 Tax=Aquirufa nivalisilvae TaxID=2516557 RepID=UPI0022A91FC7|nr:c-type cytochrome [Aquirufa nivalisilvae]